MKWFGRLAGVASFGSALLILAGLFGSLAPPLDSLAHFRAHLVFAVFATVLFAFVFGRRISRMGAVFSCVVSVYGALTVAPFTANVPEPLHWMVGPFANVRPVTMEAPPDPHFTLLQMNLLHRADVSPGLETIREVDADFVTLEEVSHRWRDALGTVADLYPHRADCSSDRLEAGVMMLSKRPIVGEVVCEGRLRFLAANVEIDEGERITIGVQHLFWPWPRNQSWQLRRLASTLADLPKPLVIGGDFNAAPWSVAVTRYAEASGTEPVAGIGPTYAPSRLPKSWTSVVGLPIDHVLVSDEIDVHSAGTLQPTGSDHLPVFVRFSISEASY